MKQTLPRNFTWVHCNQDFTGYYTLSYTKENWGILAHLLSQEYTVRIKIKL